MNDSNKCTPLGICRPGRRNGDLLAAQGPGALDPRRLRLCPPRGQHRCRGRRSGLLGQAHGGDHGQQAQQAQRADRRRHPRHRLPEDLRSRSSRGRVLSRCKRRRRPQLAVQGAAQVAGRRRGGEERVGWVMSGACLAGGRSSAPARTAPRRRTAPTAGATWPRTAARRASTRRPASTASRARSSSTPRGGSGCPTGEGR